MFVFIAPLKHPLNSSDYTVVEENLRRTLISICSQTCKEFKVIIVGNKIPEWKEEFQNHVDFIKLEMSPISDEKSNKISMDIAHVDKGIKVAIGIKEAQKYAPDYLMFFDCDDLISNKIVDFTQNQPKSNQSGWYVRSGYVLNFKTNELNVNRSFNNICGTSNIVSNRSFSTNEFRGLKIVQRKVSFKLNLAYFIYILKRLMYPIIYLGLIKNHILTRYWILRVRKKNTDILTILDSINVYDDSARNLILSEIDIDFLKNILGNHPFTWDYFGLKELPFSGAIWCTNNGDNLFASGSPSNMTKSDFTFLNELEGFGEKE
ncbi:MAG: glycosyltransferase family 2 protein [Reichenbachiella sp.]